MVSAAPGCDTLAAMDPRVVKPRKPLRVIIGAALIGVALMAFVIFAVWQSGRDIADARMSGTITGKEFIPAAERQISLGRDGQLAAQNKEGDFILTVKVPGANGESKVFQVWLPDRKQYDAVEVGDTFDVGPYLIKE